MDYPIPDNSRRIGPTSPACNKVGKVPLAHLGIGADWIQKPVADTPNNWVQIEKTKDGKYLAAVGKETFDVEIKLSLTDGKILSATLDNPLQTIERECEDAALTKCGDSKPHPIKRQIQIALEQ
jgi:hypothetical protein